MLPSTRQPRCRPAATETGGGVFAKGIAQSGWQANAVADGAGAKAAQVEFQHGQREYPIASVRQQPHQKPACGFALNLLSNGSGQGGVLMEGPQTQSFLRACLETKTRS
jgi:hypothetical protein